MIKREMVGTVFKERHAKRETTHELHPPFPENALVELTNACNHECVFCTNPRMTRQIARLELSTFTAFVREAVPLGLRELGFYTTGDPLMTRNLEDYVRAAAEAGVVYRYMTTNGALGTPEKFEKLIEAGISSIKFSINAGSRETYRLVHGSDDFERVLENVRWLHARRVRDGLDLRILASCVVTRATEHEKTLHRETFGPYVDDILYVDAHGQSGQSIDEARRVTPTHADLSFAAPGTREPCFMLWKRVHLTAEGYLTLCCVDYENNLTYAQFGDGRSLLEHWHNAVITEMRRRHIAQQLEGTLCQKCFYGGDAPHVPLTNLGRQSITGEATRVKLRRLAERLDVISPPAPGAPASPPPAKPDDA